MAKRNDTSHPHHRSQEWIDRTSEATRQVTEVAEKARRDAMIASENEGENFLQRAMKDLMAAPAGKRQNLAEWYIREAMRLELPDYVSIAARIKADFLS